MNILRFDKFLKFDSELFHFVSTREKGFSKKPFLALNMAFHVGDNSVDVLRNRLEFSKKVKIPLKKFVFANQTHSENIFIVKKEDCGMGAFEQKNSIVNTDAFITEEKNVCIVVLVADCVPVVLFDKKKKVVAVIHAGWQGTVKKIVEKTVKKMINEFNCEPKNIIAGVGPSIGPCHFEVQNDVFVQFQDIFGEEDKGLIYRKEKLFIDLWEINKQQLLVNGILLKNIEIMKKCTVCENNYFFSARKERITGRFAVGVMLK